jgi:hypothetical protein
MCFLIKRCFKANLLVNTLEGKDRGELSVVSGNSIQRNKERLDDSVKRNPHSQTIPHGRAQYYKR